MPNNDIIAATGGVAQEEWLRDESEHPYKFVPTKASGNTVPFPAITKCNTFILRHYAAGIVEEIGQRMYDGDLAMYLKGLQKNEPRFFSAIMVAAREAMKENVKDAMRTFALMDE